MSRSTTAYLRFLARWDSDQSLLMQALEALAGTPVSFAGSGAPADADALFSIFDRDPLDAVTQRPDGGWLLPFHPWAAYRAVVEERYLNAPAMPLHARTRLPYHWVPGALRLALYPLVAGRPPADPEACPPHPAWPIEPRIDTFRSLLFHGVTGVPIEPGTAPPERGLWPGEKRSPLLFTVDIDTAAGMKGAGDLLDDLVRWGVRPTFFLVGRAYTWDRGFIHAVRQAGGEVALHGDLHDNRISFEPPQRIARRLDSVRDLCELHGVRGFRSPSLLVSDDLYEHLQPRFHWDSSVPDTDTHTLLGPRRGCGTLFPFRRNELLVLPITMPSDDRLLALGRDRMDLVDTLRRKWRWIREVGGLCHFLVHGEPHLFGRQILRDLFRSVLDEIRDSGEVWEATPSEVADYWTGLLANPPAD